MFLHLVIHQCQHSCPVLTHLSLLLCQQLMDTHQSKRSKSLMASSMDMKQNGTMPGLACMAHVISPFRKQTSRWFIGGKSCVGLVLPGAGNHTMLQGGRIAHTSVACHSALPGASRSTLGSCGRCNISSVGSYSIGVDRKACTS